MPCSCCAGQPLDIFGERGARRELRRYLRKGLGGDDAQQMVAWAEAGGLGGATVVEVGAACRRVSTRRQVQLERQHTIHAKAEINVLKALDGRNEHAGAREKRESQGHLRGRQDAPYGLLAA